MSAIDELSVQPIEQRLADLTKRQRHLMICCGLSAAVFMLSITALFMQQSWIYAFFDLSIQVQHLDLPYSLQDLVPYTQPVDYFFNLLSWVGWLLLKTVLAFFGAFILLRWSKKIGFFQSRFQAWTQRFVAWLIAFIVLWSGLSYVQYARKNDTTQAQKQWISYSHHINESDIAQDLLHADISSTERAYVLAQVALLQQPTDRRTANIFVNQLIQAENNNPTQFAAYDFKLEQLWVMQQQLYGKSITLRTQALDLQAQQAQRISQGLNIALWLVAALLLLLSIILFLLAKHLKSRAERIRHNLHVE